ncbi:hypothetical protein KM043_012057 [Ampulex compressa]|nr:hypothetical protein KM043_012057 [Ampulex compressa]
MLRDEEPRFRAGRKIGGYPAGLIAQADTYPTHGSGDTSGSEGASPRAEEEKAQGDAFKAGGNEARFIEGRIKYIPPCMALRALETMETTDVLSDPEMDDFPPVFIGGKEIAALGLLEEKNKIGKSANPRRISAP